MTDNVADLLDRVGAFVASNRSGLIAGATGSLWPSIVAHALYDMAVPFLSRMDAVPSDPAEQAA